MPCNTNILQNIINSCNPIKGIEPIIFWDYRSNLQFTFVDNTITAITAAPLGRIEVKKFGINAGHDIVVLENQVNRFKHKVEAVINTAGQVLDTMDDVVFFVKENGSTTWKIYGAKYGCWKSSQASMINDNLNTVAISFESREGMEEEYECYNTTIDIAALPNMLNFDLIYGGTIASGGLYELVIDSLPSMGYIQFPNGSIVTTTKPSTNHYVSGTYNGVGGAITYYIPKVAGTVSLSSLIAQSAVAGKLDFTSVQNVDTFIAGGTNATSMKFNNKVGSISVGFCGQLSELIAPKAVTIGAQGCALTAKSIGDILYQAYVDNRLNVVYNFSGGTNKTASEIDTYLINTYGILLENLLQYMIYDLNGTFNINV